MRNELFDYSPINRRPRLEWPNGARIAFYVGYNIEYWHVDKPAVSISPHSAVYTPDPLNFGWRDYGLRVGVWRMMDLLDTVGIRATVPLNSEVCEHCPQISEEGNKRNWVWVAHGKTNSIMHANMAPDEERRSLTEMVEAIRLGTGTRPKGWLGPGLTETFNTPRILSELGFTYILDWCNDDQPYPLNVRTGRMISVPYQVELNDLNLFVGKNLSGQDFYQMVVDEFDMLYEEAAESGRVMTLSLHPYLINRSFRQKYLAKALDYVVRHDKVWVTTGDDLADWYLEHGVRSPSR
jgi:peptidoglycan/xylan/chitin deacetylase (PgdA/CDA1 family)